MKLDGRKVDNLITLGMSMFDAAGIHIAPSKMYKLVRESIGTFGYIRAERIVREYFETAENLQWESYRRALTQH